MDTAVEVDHERARDEIRTAYLDFLERKVDVAPTFGQGDFNWGLMHPSTKPHQRDSVRWALEQGRALIAASFGLGKTQVQAEIARLLVAATGRPFLQVAPLGVRQQFTEEDGPRLGIQYRYVGTDEEIQQALSEGERFLITNYERVRDGQITPAVHGFCGASCDEASIMGNLGTDTYEQFTKAFWDFQYLFFCSATPVPNDYGQIIHYAHALRIMDAGQARTRWFKRNPSKAGDLAITPGKEDEFWLWVSTWSLWLEKPSDMGYSDEGYDLPELHIHWHRIALDEAGYRRVQEYADNRGQLRLLPAAQGGVSEKAREKKATIEDRIAVMLQILADNPDRHWLLWHSLEDERRAIERAVPGSLSVYGSLDLEERERRVLDFSHGRIPILNTKPQLSGSGCNFQRHCYSNIVMGADYDKFKDLLQSIKRTHRFLQAHSVDVHFIYTESQDREVDNFRRKWHQHDELMARMRSIIRQYGLSHGAVERVLRRRIGVRRQETRGQRFVCVNNDCVLELLNMPDDSVDMGCSSSPFDDHYEFTEQYEDFGHNPNGGFFAQMDYLLPQLYRVLKPGRIFVMHSKNRILYGHQTAHGFMEVDPFVPRMILAFQRHGFLFAGEHTVVTDVVRENNATYRLGYSEMCRDATKMGAGLCESVLVFRKPPSSRDTARADEPVTKDRADYRLARWQVDAHGFWRSDGNVVVPQTAEEQVRFLLQLFAAKEPYDYQSHVERLTALEERGNLPKTHFHEPPTSNSPWVWDNVVAMHCLNANQVRRRVDQHICPFPIDIVRRVIRLYSNPGDLVLDPFAGLGTTPYIAVELGRRGYGIELSPQYYEDMVYYCRQAESKAMAPTLFDLSVYSANAVA